jgi:hypothetical protein
MRFTCGLESIRISLFSNPFHFIRLIFRHSSQICSYRSSGYEHYESSVALSLATYKEEVGLFLDVAGTPRATIDIAEICELAPDGVTPLQPLKLVTDYRTLIATRVVEDILRDHPARDKIEDIIVSNDDFLFFTRDVNGED